MLQKATALLIVLVFLAGQVCAPSFAAAPQVIDAATLQSYLDSTGQNSVANNVVQNVDVSFLNNKAIVEVTAELALSNEMQSLLWQELMKDESLNNDAREALMREVTMATSVGGIGPLLGERIRSLSKFGADTVAVSLLYKWVWVQKINADLSLTLEPHEIGHYLKKILTNVGEVLVKMHTGEEVMVRLWQAPPECYDGARVYFLEVPDAIKTLGLEPTEMNAVPGRSSVVYPGWSDAAHKKDNLEIAQKWILGRGALALLGQEKIDPGFIIISEMFAAFADPCLIKWEDDPYYEKFRNVHVVFNDHTPLDYAHKKRSLDYMRWLHINPEYYENMPLYDRGLIDETAMMVNASDTAYGVAEKHGRVMRAMRLLIQFGYKIKSVTNGVGYGWEREEFAAPERVAAYSNEELLSIKDKGRKELLQWLEARQEKQLYPGWAQEMVEQDCRVIVWCRRVVGYKRLDLFMSLLEDEALREAFIKAKLVVVIGGRMHQDDPYGREQFARLSTLWRQFPVLQQRVIFFENYNRREAPRLFQGADISMMLAFDGFEAAATGFQKGQMNGCAIIATSDGAVPESVIFYDEKANNLDEANGFCVPYDATASADGREVGAPSKEGLMQAFAQCSAAYHDDAVRVKFINNALRETPHVHVDRTAADMLKLFRTQDRYVTAKALLLARGRGHTKKMLAHTPWHESMAPVIGSKNDMQVSGFIWKYGEDEQHLIDSGKHLYGFLQGFDRIRDHGTVGDWSLLYHAERNHAGDFAMFILELLKDVQGLDEFKAELETLGIKIRNNRGDAKKINQSYELFGMVQGLYERLLELRPSAEQYVLRAA
jgi:glucan phosphorylase